VRNRATKRRSISCRGHHEQLRHADTRVGRVSLNGSAAGGSIAAGFSANRRRAHTRRSVPSGNSVHLSVRGGTGLGEVIRRGIGAAPPLAAPPFAGCTRLAPRSATRSVNRRYITADWQVIEDLEAQC
jgi:hypothetical protein